jgi:hypothetical protein
MSPLTLSELKDKLSRLDPEALVELLRVTSEQLVTYLEDYIEENIEQLVKEIDDYE